MEMERINDDLIKVLIGVQDLKERGVNFLDLIGDRKRIEHFFYSILEEVDAERHFQESDTVTFQVIPNAEGLELYISRNSLDGFEVFPEKKGPSRLKRRINSKKLEVDMLLDMSELDDVDIEAIEPAEIVTFNSLNDFLAVAKIMAKVDIQSTLYYLHNRFFLALGEISPEMSEDEAYHHFVTLLEYGYSFPITEAVLREYGEVIRQDDALAFFAKL
ncbi:adaptor protein MecA [Aerococcaceae bacterium NML191292]|nr:adaptor protein MecA [Aerococcaceae bacterium NML210727]MCW6655206.1 adaptor protein MecA [Aerococcaceae bacterium NML201296]MCW6659648.1 adaptor protein MecA [Aerococcaceae bacterium NML191292]MCW6661336.1 adaptor protein MecA [Aerococcaceae bacterium NML201209]MCW6667257.1 adaptor protein MecA [Aerococcaceae bacterium NML190938]MCW6674456.1 adaptor protein MecA [Aerococcaceae bacterium NML171108]MCW6682116.1 adaptor protein MecA [Aerococcaceae bacterium NML160702]